MATGRGAFASPKVYYRAGLQPAFPGGALRPGWFTNLFTYDMLDDKISEDMDATNSNPASLLTSYTYDPNVYFMKEIIGARRLAHDTAASARPGPPSLTLSALIGDDGNAAQETRIFRETATVGGATNRQCDLLMNSPNGRMRIARHEVAAQCRETAVKMIEKVPAGRLNLCGTTTARKRGIGYRAKATVPAGIRYDGTDPWASPARPSHCHAVRNIAIGAGLVLAGGGAAAVVIVTLPVDAIIAIAAAAAAALAGLFAW